MMIKAEVELMRTKTGYSLKWILTQLSICWSTYHKWLKWKPIEKKGFVHPLKALQCEEATVVQYAESNVGTGYKKLTYQMLDADIAALTPAQVYRILSEHDLLDKWGTVKGGAGKEYKPTKPNEHWHTDIMYIKVLEMWCFLIVVLDGYSRYVVGWKVMLDMTSQSVSLFMQEVIDENSSNGVKLIHDNGSQLISNDFKKVLLSGNIQQLRIKRNHPQSNGKIERFNGLVRQECLRPNSPISIPEVEKTIAGYIDHYNNHRLHSAIDFMRPVDYYKGSPDNVRKLRQEKLYAAKKRRIEENRKSNLSLKATSTAYSNAINCSV